MAEEIKETTSAPADESLEKSLARLDAILERMESGNQTLDELLADYEAGASLIKACQDRLQAAEKRIFSITKTLDGSLSLQEISPGEDEEA
jgi:exodeoxyribonuclease VII small subunit